MKIKTTRVLDIKKANRRASVFSALAGGAAGLAFTTLLVTASTMDFEDAIGRTLHSDLYYLLVFAGCLALIGVSYLCSEVAAHIRDLIATAIHEKNEREWSKR